MENKKYQVFVSSTYNDLTSAREKVIETILSLYHFPIGMEMFSADDDEQWDIIRDTIDVSDYYVIIIGHRYGSTTSDGISYTEKEYDYAKSQGIPILAFIRNRDVATKADERENSSAANKKLDEFIKKASGSKMCDYWSSIEELSAKVAIALPKTFSRKPRIGWIRSNSAVSKEVSEEIAKLSNENRELRERLLFLEAEANRQIPKIDVVINSSSGLQLSIPGHIPDEIHESPSPLLASDIPSHLSTYISEDQIQEYNNNLPSKEIIEKYNDQNKIFWLAQNAAIPLKIWVKNHGSGKANDINITIAFPKNVLVVSNENLPKITQPRKPFPISPIDTAEKKYQEEHRTPNVLDNLKLFLETRNTVINPLPIHNNIPRLIDINRDWRLSVKSNIVNIRIKSLLHTRVYTFEEITLIPLNLGNSAIQVSVICEELREENTNEIPLQVNEQQQD